MSIRRTFTVLAGLGAVGAAAPLSFSPAIAAQGNEAARVVREACGDQPEPACVAKLQKVCRAKVTFRCYYARKRRIDGSDRPESPEKSDERDDRSIFYDE